MIGSLILTILYSLWWDDSYSLYCMCTVHGGMTVLSMVGSNMFTVLSVMGSEISYGKILDTHRTVYVLSAMVESYIFTVLSMVGS